MREENTWEGTLWLQRINTSEKSTGKEEDLGDHTNTEGKDEDKISEYEEVKVDEEEVCNDLLHYINVIKQQEEKRKKERREEERKRDNIRWKLYD